MTRQEQKAVKELSTMLSKNLKVVAGEHGFKVVSDCAYKVLGDSVKVGPGHGHLKRAQKTSPANQEVFRARVSKWEEVRQNQRRSCLGIQGT